MQGTSFAESRQVAAAYLDNPGYGGALLWSCDISATADRVLDLRGLSTAEAAERLGQSDPGAIGVDEWLASDSDAQDAARATGALWALVDESHPAETTTWIWLGTSDDLADEPELEQIED